MIEKQLKLLLLLSVVTGVLWACTQPMAVISPTAVFAPSATAVPTPAITPPATLDLADLDTITFPTLPAEGVTGSLTAVGSSTVYPLTQHMAALFNKAGFTGQVRVDSVGTGAGFDLFCQTAAGDMVNASRPIQLAERRACLENGREPLEFRVGTDAVAIVVSRENDFAQDITLNELRLLFSTAVTWADVRPTWPAEPILRYAPGTASGTFDYFVEQVLARDPLVLLGAANLVTSEDDHVLVQGVESSPYAVGFFGFAYYVADAAQLRPLAVEGVPPQPQTVETGLYPLARPLFIYTTADIMQDKPQVAAFINFYLAHVNEEIQEVGYFPISEDQLAVSRFTWLVGNGLNQ